MKHKINEIVTIVATASPQLDKQRVMVVGYHGQGYVIVLFMEDPPIGYDPGMVISESCLK